MAARGKSLLEHGMRDMYDAEHRFVDALGTMIEGATDPTLEEGFRRHQRITKEQIRRLERAFDEIGVSAKREDCPGSKGLIAEYQKFVKEEKPDAATLDTFAAEAGLKVEHYEIASYRTLVNLAQFLGYDACVRLFRQSLAEEEQAAAELQSEGTRLAAELTGAGMTGLAMRAGVSVLDTVREGTLIAAQTARSVGGAASRRAGKAVRSAQARGRATRGTSTRAKTTTRKTTARKTAAAKKPARKTATRKTSARSTGTRTRSRKA